MKKELKKPIYDEDDRIVIAYSECGSGCGGTCGSGCGGNCGYKD